VNTEKCYACGGTGTLDGKRCDICKGNGLIAAAPKPDAEQVLSVFEAVKVMPLRPTDVLVLKAPFYIPQATANEMRDRLAAVLPGIKVLICDAGMDVEVIRKE
jgi:hypothetical protein